VAAQLYSLELNKGVAGLPTVNHEASSQAVLTGPHTWDQSDNTEYGEEANHFLRFSYILFSDPSTIGFRLLANERGSPSLHDRYVSTPRVLIKLQASAPFRC